MKKINWNKLLGICIILLLSFNLAFALRADQASSEISTVSRMTGENAIDIINQLDTKQLDITHGTAALNDYNPGVSDVFKKGFRDANYRAYSPTIESYYKLNGIESQYTDAEFLSEAINSFKPNELFVLDYPDDVLDNDLEISNVYSMLSILSSKDLSNMSSNFAKTNPLLISGVRNSGLFYQIKKIILIL